MRRIILSFLLALVSVMSGFAQNNAMYVYRNDGEFNAFLKCDVDSMRYSRLDLDSIFHDEWQMQEIFTSDSVYRIPLAAIDSISFVTPETIVNKDVFPLTADHDAYLSECDTISFHLSLATPSAMRPARGNVVVSTFDCTSFPDGIMARVVSVAKEPDGYYYSCEQVGIGDVYDQLVCVSESIIGIPDEENELGRGRKISADFELWNIPIVDKTISYGGTTTTFSGNDTAVMRLTAFIKHGMPNYFQLRLQNDLATSITFNATSSYGWREERRFFKRSFGRIPIPGAPLLSIVPKFSLSGYFEEHGEVSLDFKAHYNRTDKVDFTFKNNEWSVEYKPKNDPGIDVASLSMKGYAEIGLIPDLLFSFCGSATGLGLEYSIGIRESIDFKFDALAAYDKGFYAGVKDSYARTTLPQQLRVYAAVGLWGDGVQPYSWSKDFEPQLGTDRYVFPEFTEPVCATASTKTSVILSSDVTRDLLLPVELGMAVYDKDNNLVSQQFDIQSYRMEKDWSGRNLALKFDDIEPGTYECYPMVKLFGKEFVATPSSKFDVTALPAHVTDVCVTKSYYKQNGYSNNGQTYDYKFEVATTVETESTDGVYDWGYVYGDPDGKVTHISLKNFSSPYTDTRYVYYRNSASSSVRLYGYVRYSENGEYYYDEPQEFILKHEEELHLCPDDHHPHMIDLGLPSGTKWACCNVGATEPEGFGDYFAWGETEPKDYYYWNTYKWCNGSYDSMTKYCTADGKTELAPEDDAAYVNWGKNWRMPSIEQISELCNSNYTTTQWTTQNGVNGCLITRKSNGASLFLPAAGELLGDYLNVGSYGGCWSRSLFTDNSACAYNLFFYSGSSGWWGLGRCEGQSVRPVENKPTPARITEFEVTDSFHGEKSYSNNGETFDYKFEVVTTVTLDDNVNLDDVEDWGYVCEEGDDNITHISLKDYSSPYTHNAVYYRNTASSTVRLYGYTLYKGNDEYFYDEPHDFPLKHKEESLCSDEHHPHVIDLGLPSGTKWACCNVGATEPEGFGDYFAWGETEPKDYYDWNTYKWMMAGYSDWRGCSKYTYPDGYTSASWYNNGLFIGDYNTTLYPENDAAHVNWGGAWRMPTKAEQDELRNNCTWTWTSQNGVNGYKVVGPKGNSLFLPAAGYRRGGSLYSAGSFGDFWSSSLNTWRSDCAYNLSIYSGDVDWENCGRRYGFSVRPVCQ